MSDNAAPLRFIALGSQAANGSITGVSDDESMGQPCDCSQYPQLTLYLTSVSTTSGGVVTIEEADYDPRLRAPYGGTWSVIKTIDASSFTGGVTLAYHFPAPSCYAWVRVRVSDAITGGGTVYAVLRGN